MFGYYSVFPRLAGLWSLACKPFVVYGRRRGPFTVLLAGDFISFYPLNRIFSFECYRNLEVLKLNFTQSQTFSCSQNALTFDFGIKLEYILANLIVNLLTVKLYNLSPVLDIQIDSFFDPNSRTMIEYGQK